jgi:hypothetical protein
MAGIFLKARRVFLPLAREGEVKSSDGWSELVNVDCAYLSLALLPQGAGIYHYI